VTFPGVGAVVPEQSVDGSGATSQGSKSASPATSSPVPPGLAAFVGPVEDPHQLHVASTVPTCPPSSMRKPSSTKFADPSVCLLLESFLSVSVSLALVEVNVLASATYTVAS